MRHQWVRRVFVGLILMFPILMRLVASPSAWSFLGSFQAILPVVAVEMVLVGGLLFARRERRRLLGEVETAGVVRSRMASRPSTTLVNTPNSTAWRPVSGSPGV